MAALVVLLIGAGCMAPGGNGTTDGGAATTPEQVEPTATPEPTSVQTASPSKTTTTEEEYQQEYGYGTQFVSVDQIDQSKVPNVSKSSVRTFENLSERRQETFERALEEEKVTFEPEEALKNPFDWNNDSRPKYVRDEDEWYYVQVAIV